MRATAGDRFKHSAGHAVLSSTPCTAASRSKAIVESTDPVSPSANTAQLRQTIRLTAPQAPTYHRPLPDPIRRAMTESPNPAIRPKAPPRAAPPLCAPCNADAVLARPNGPLRPPLPRGPKYPSAVGAVQPTPYKTKPLLPSSPPVHNTAASPRPRGRSLAPDYFLLLPDQLLEPLPPTGLAAVFLAAAFPVPCSCLGLHSCSRAARPADYARRPRQKCVRSRNVRSSAVGASDGGSRVGAG
ncbi:hypothetical protein VC83_01923 [Pseudogymnoascus destructans]|uniref:Uncharacterized protein n=2 Tax=Pseudogymnoascus destructans TaxID=655981 RepID=L8GBK9_PSED2|nr:uncharacterized protein VC83_01923 [Pseudogymnoascus destructans]ELR09431.1 hypothetical protein GMDG_03991 [Pseudogymnoascus destructans 20631-21]OAF61692.1 hypothetical protein VC83_01923 [Pseudogymnoascus destructans]